MMCIYTCLFEGEPIKPVVPQGKQITGSGLEERDKKGEEKSLKSSAWLSVILKEAGDSNLLLVRTYSNLGWIYQLKYEENVFRQR